MAKVIAAVFYFAVLLALSLVGSCAPGGAGVEIVSAGADQPG